MYYGATYLLEKFADGLGLTNDLKACFPETDELPQINLLLVFGERSGLPFYYRKLAGNIPDSKTVKHLLEDLDILGLGKTKFVMDRGFYSEDNINGLYKEHIKFLVGTRISLKFIREHLDGVYDDIRKFVNYDEGINTYGYTVAADWAYTQVMSSRKNAEFTSTIITVLIKVLMMNRLLAKGLQAFIMNWLGETMLKAIKKHMTSSSKFWQQGNTYTPVI